MAINLDLNLLAELGLGSLPDEEKRSLLNHIYETLEMRVGMRLADQMSNEQLEEFEKYFEAKDDAGAFKWLETNFPNYKEIVQDEFNKLKEEVRQSAPQILQSSQSQPQSAPIQGGSYSQQPLQDPAQTQPYPQQPVQPPQNPYQPPMPPSQPYPPQTPQGQPYQPPMPPQNPPYQPPQPPGPQA